MILNQEQRAAMLEAAKPLIKWLNDNCHPECSTRVDQTSVELRENVARDGTEEFLKD